MHKNTRAAAAAKAYKPAFVDHYQSATYCHVMTRVEPDGSLVAIFADGHEAPSVYPNVGAMLQAGANDYRERMVPVQEGGR